jgi:hypothetical protein
MFRLVPRNFLQVLCAISLLLFASCTQERVVLVEPKEGDLVVLNGCVVSACNYLALLKAKHTLEANFWTRILLIRYDNHPAGHAYCVWETEGTVYGYDRNSGGFPIPVYTRDPRAIAIVLSQELSRIMKEPLTVKSADFIEPADAKLRKFPNVSELSSPARVLGTSPFIAGELSLKKAVVAEPFTRE